MKKGIPILLLLVVTACATPAQRITRKLVDIGVPDLQASCIGNRLGADLTIGELRRVNELAGLDRDRFGRMTINQLLRQLNHSGDTKLVGKVLRAGLSCAI
jgi:hypothetical protein